MQIRFIIEYHDNNTGQSVMYWSTSDPNTTEIDSEFLYLKDQIGIEHLVITRVLIEEEFS